MIYIFPYISNIDSKKSSNTILNSVGWSQLIVENPRRQEQISMSLIVVTVLNIQTEFLVKRDGTSALSDSPSVGKEQGFSIKDVSQSLKLAGFFFFFSYLLFFDMKPIQDLMNYKYLNLNSVTNLSWWRNRDIPELSQKNLTKIKAETLAFLLSNRELHMVTL